MQCGTTRWTVDGADIHNSLHPIAIVIAIATVSVMSVLLGEFVHSYMFIYSSIHVHSFIHTCSFIQAMS